MILDITKAYEFFPKLTKKNKCSCVSLYGNPLHPGHIDLINYATLWGEVIVIVNNDKQVALKGSTPFMNERLRLEMVNAIRNVEYTILSIDTDESIAQTLKLINPRVFINAGDRYTPNDKELAVCREMQIPMMFVPHLPKRESSSKLIDAAIHYTLTSQK